MSKEGAISQQRLKSLQAELEARLGDASRGIHNMSTVPLSEGLLQDVEMCLRSEAHAEIRTGFFVLKGLMADRALSELPEKFRSMLIQRVEELLGHSFAGVVYDAVDWLGQLRDSFPRYRGKMLQFLMSSDTGLRRAALRYYPTYAMLGEVEPLLPFRNDGSAEEIRPLGDYRYIFRDQALELIELQVGQKFPAAALSEAYEGGKVTWRDWRPFLEWWLHNNPGHTR